MGTTKTDTTKGAFDPTSMQTFQGLAGALGQTLPGFMTNPFGSPQFGLESQMGTRQAQGLGGTGMSDLLRNMTASGMAGGASSPAGLEMQQNQGRANTGLQAQLGFMNPMMQALQRQQFAMGLGSQYRPLQTGQTQTESTQGLGSWLPQLLQGGLSAAAMIPTGGMSAIGPMMSQMGHVGQGAGGWSGMGGASPFQPSTFDPGNQLQGPSNQLPPWFGGGQP